MDKGDINKIRHIQRYCEDIGKTIERFGNSFETFSQDMDYCNSISMNIMQIGELSVGLSEVFKSNTQEQIPWGLIKGMRNHFAHGYAAMDMSDIWETAIHDIPHLLAFCESIIKGTHPDN